MYFVYLIKSLKFPKQSYIGQTDNLQERLETHNSGGSTFTASFRLWRLVSCVGLDNKEQAIEFEKYLKSGSGRAFAKKLLW